MRIAPNNNLPATHFIEVWKGGKINSYQGFVTKLKHLNIIIKGTKDSGFRTIAVFRIRENKLPTLHDFSNRH